LESREEDAIRGCTLQECVAVEADTQLCTRDVGGSANAVETEIDALAVVHSEAVVVGLQKSLVPSTVIGEVLRPPPIPVVRTTWRR
jgi:hypothetical protein